MWNCVWISHETSDFKRFCFPLPWDKSIARVMFFIILLFSSWLYVKPKDINNELLQTKQQLTIIYLNKNWYIKIFKYDIMNISNVRKYLFPNLDKKVTDLLFPLFNVNYKTRPRNLPFHRHMNLSSFHLFLYFETCHSKCIFLSRHFWNWCRSLISQLIISSLYFPATILLSQKWNIWF